MTDSPFKLFDVLALDCICAGGGRHRHCLCSAAEKYLRHCAALDVGALELSNGQRAWCIMQIRGNIAAGAPIPPAAEFAAMPDKDLARATLVAWHHSRAAGLRP